MHMGKLNEHLSLVNIILQASCNGLPEMLIDCLFNFLGYHILLLYFIIFYFIVPTEAPRNVFMTVNSSSSVILTWERPSPEEENGLLLLYHVIVIETQIHYFDNGTEFTGMQRYLNRTYNVSEGRAQLINSLHPDYNYTVRIAAATEPGIGPFSDVITVRTNMDGE